MRGYRSSKSDCLRAVDHSNDNSFEYGSLPTLSAPQARLERATYCLGGIPEACPGVARCGLTWDPAATIMAGYGPAWPGAWRRWLPIWLPVNSLAALMFEWLGIHASPTPDSGHDLTQPQLGHPCARYGPSRRALETASASWDLLVVPDDMAFAARNAIVADGRQCTTTDRSNGWRFRRSVTPTANAAAWAV